MTEPAAPDFTTIGSTDAQTKRRRKIIIISVLAIAFLLIAGLLGGTAWYRTQNMMFYVPSTSMSPTLQVNDRVSTKKLSGSTQLTRGEVVVHDNPNQGDSEVRSQIKRIVALPGETVEARGGLVYVNNVLLQEPYLETGTVTRDLRPVVVSPGSYYVMGDNRENSYDSRAYGAVARSKFTHHVKAITFPIDRRRSLE